MFTKKLLIQISGVSPRTFYRKLKGLKVNTKGSSYLDEKQALLVAKEMGFVLSLNSYIQMKNEKIFNSNHKVNANS